MVDQLPNLGRESEMLSVMGMASMDELFADIPDEVILATWVDAYEGRYSLINADS